MHIKIQKNLFLIIYTFYIIVFTRNYNRYRMPLTGILLAV